MTIDFEELDYRPTALGDLVLRRRRDPRIGNVEIFEVKLGDDFLMSSLFHDSEIALADLGLARLAGRLLRALRRRPLTRYRRRPTRRPHCRAAFGSVYRVGTGPRFR